MIGFKPAVSLILVLSKQSMTNLRQTTIWEALNKEPPSDQLLVIGTSPQESNWVDLPYKFDQPFQQFSLGDYAIGVFRANSRFFIGNDPWDETTGVFSSDPTERNSKLVPYLKSQIQKAIRRNLPNEACQAAWTILKQDPLKLLRRLPIIMVEDKKVHEDLPLLVWGMLKLTKRPGWKIPIPFVSRVMSIVWDLASAPDCIPRSTNVGRMKAKDVAHLSACNKSYVASLVIRADYGGTLGDKALLVNKAFEWTHEPLEPIKSSILVACYPLQDSSMWDHWIPEAFDFHVTNLLPWLCENVTFLDDVIRRFDPKLRNLDYVDLLRKVVWYYYSSARFCSVCETVDPLCGHHIIPEGVLKMKIIWDFIKEHVYSFSRGKIEEVRTGRRKKDQSNKGKVKKQKA